MSQKALREKVEAEHKRRFGKKPAFVAFAPGRVEILGNHTDYNEGFALSAGMEQGVVFALSGVKDSKCRLYSIDLDEEASFDMQTALLGFEMPWVNYCKGVLYNLQKKGAARQGFNATLSGDIPMGAGLASSAALEVATALALSAYYKIEMEPIEMAKLCQQAETEFAGVRCGLLDQVTSLLAREDHLVFTDFRSLTVEHIPFLRDVSLILCNVGAKHRLANTEYNKRRVQCEEATAVFARLLDHEVGALRDVSLKELQQYTERLDALVMRRAAHVINENQRVLQGAKLLKRGEAFLFGALLFASHESSMLSFENSSSRQDEVVLWARRRDGVTGARLSGGGFGGNVLILADTAEGETVMEELREEFAGAGEKQFRVQMFWPARGAALLAG